MRALWLLCALLLQACSSDEREGSLAWAELAPLPDAHGFAGAFAGVSGDALLVAGGANFPDGRPWEGASKVWHRDVWVLEAADGEWLRLADALPRALAYGVSASHDGALFVVGGSDGESHSAAVYELRWGEDDLLSVRERAAMPAPLAFSQGAVVDGRLYVAGGLEQPDAKAPTSALWSLELASPEAEWETHAALPGAPRMLASAGTLDGALYVFGGTDLDESLPAGRAPLVDAWRYSEGPGWTRLADLPRAAIAAPSPTPELGQSHLLVLGGDDGRHYGTPASDAHPGFLAEILAYHAITDTWRPIGELPHAHGPDPAGDPHAGTWAPVTTSVVRWNDAWVLPSGEVRPGVRTPRVLSATLQRSQRGLSRPDYAVLAVYFAALVAMGVWFSRRERTTEDFFLGGRRIPWWAAGASVFGTQLSAITFMAIPAKSFSSDWVFFVGNMTIPLVAPIVVFVYLPFFRRLELTSAYEYLELRFGYGVRALGSASYLLFQLGRMGIVLFLPALALEAVTGIPVQTCILVMGVLATIYAVLGGIEAVIWTDVLQVVVLLGGALLSLFIIAAGVDGGLPAIWSEADAAGKLHWANLDWDIASSALWVVVLGNIFNTLVSYTSDQSVVQRYLATADEKSAARSIWTNAALTIPSSLLFYGIGTALWAYYRAHPEGLDATGSNDEIFPWFIAGQLPVGVAGLVIAGLFAAAMSSLDSSMNSMATVITTDFYRRLRPSVTERSCLALARVLTGALGVAGTLAALYLASLGTTSMLDQYLKVIGLFGGGLAGLFAAGIFLPRVSGAGATAGLAASAVILYFVQRSGQVHFLLYAAIGVLSCCLVGSLLTPLLPNPPRDLAKLTWSTRR